MKQSDLRIKLHQYLDDADNESLQYINEAVVAYKAKKKKENKANPEPSPRFPSMTEEELFAQIERSEENLKNGKYLSHEDAFALLKSWHAKV